MSSCDWLVGPVDPDAPVAPRGTDTQAQSAPEVLAAVVRVVVPPPTGPTAMKVPPSAPPASSGD